MRNRQIIAKKYPGKRMVFSLLFSHAIIASLNDVMMSLPEFLLNHNLFDNVITNFLKSTL